MCTAGGILYIGIEAFNMFGETTVPPVNTVSYCDPFTTSLAQCVFDRFTGGDCESTQSAIGIVCQSKFIANPINNKYYIIYIIIITHIRLYFSLC